MKKSFLTVFIFAASVGGFSRIRHEADRGPLPIDFPKRLIQHCRVVLGEPIPEKAVRDPNPQPRCIVGHKGRRLEPGVEDVTVDLRLYSGENLFPDGAAGHLSAC